MELLLRDCKPFLKIIHATTTESVSQIQMNTGASIIVIATESDSSSERVRSLVMQWHLEYLMDTGCLRNMPVIQLSGNTQVWIAGRIFSLTQRRLAYELMNIMTATIKNAEYHKTPHAGKKKCLTRKQKIVLAGTLAGCRVNEIAELLHIKPGVVFFHRQALIAKLGLRNRLELMLLKSEDFERIGGCPF